MKKLDKSEMNKIEDMYKGWDETLIWSCLQGYMGEAWVDDIDNPQAAEIIIGDFFLYAGDSSAEGAEELVYNIPEYYKMPFALMIPKDDGWARLIEKVYPKNHEAFKRYAIKKTSEGFDVDKLKEYANSLPEGYSYALIDEKIYDMASKEEFSEYFFEQFPTYEDYKKLGCGYVVMYGEELVSGATTYSIYKDGIEIELDTKETHRKKGLATAVAAKLMLHCIERGLYPSWDAANLESVRIAEKLGYYFDHEYITYSITDFR